MRSLKALALTVVSSCALLATDGCGESKGKGATSDAAPGDATTADAATVGTGGAGSGGGVAGTGEAGAGGADAKGAEAASVGSGGIAAGGAAGTATGGNGAGGIGWGDAADVASGGVGGTSTGETGGFAVGGSGGGGGRIDGGATETATGGIRDAGLGGTGGGKDASSGGTGGVSMTGGAAGGRGGTIGAGGSSASSCPQAAPANGAVCYQEDQCFYEDCASSGRAVAICVGKSWQVTTGTCTPLSCYGAGSRGSVQIACPQGQLCLATYGKDPVCVSQTCGTGPVTAGCVADAAGFCEIHGTAAVGITLLCCLTAGTSC